MEKQKLTKRERIQVTYAIEDTLDAFCRADCPFFGLNSPSVVCGTCPAAVKLRECGKLLGFAETQTKKKPVPWSDEEIDFLIRARQEMKLDDIADAFGRTYTSVTHMVHKLKKKGLI